VAVTVGCVIVAVDVEHAVDSNTGQTGWDQDYRLLLVGVWICGV